jgi:hypothetical protein
MTNMLDSIERGARQEDIWDPGGRAPTKTESLEILEEVAKTRAAIQAGDVHAAAYRGFLLGQVFTTLSIHLPAVDVLVPLAQREVNRANAKRRRAEEKREDAYKMYLTLLAENINSRRSKTAIQKKAARDAGIGFSTLRDHIKNLKPKQ